VIAFVATTLKRCVRAAKPDGFCGSIPRIGDTKMPSLPQVEVGTSSLWRHLLPTSSNGGVDGRPRPGLTGLRVLVVEDQWHVANALKSLLEAEAVQWTGVAGSTAPRTFAVTLHADWARSSVAFAGLSHVTLKFEASAATVFTCM
jgi:hypothetical protein